MKQYAVLFFIMVFCISTSLYSQTNTITFRVHIPNTTPKDDGIFIVGNMPQLGNWDPGSVQLSRSEHGYFEISLSFKKGTFLQYKITRGSWATEAMYVDKVIPANSTLTVRKDATVEIHVRNWRDLAFVQEGGITGTIKFHQNFQSPKLRLARNVAVLLPKKYEQDSERRYPVLYMHDGQNCFDPSTSFAGVDWQVDEVVDTLTEQGALQELIIVFVNNTDDRNKEYSDLPEGRAYINFLVQELKPFIDTTYRTLPEREHTAVMGSSFGGRVSFLCYLYYPNVFSKAGCLSISLQENITKRFAELLENNDFNTDDSKLYFDTGNEYRSRSYKSAWADLNKLVLKSRFIENENVLFRIYEGHDHSEKSWAKRVHVPLLFLFGND